MSWALPVGKNRGKGGFKQTKGVAGLTHAGYFGDCGRWTCRGGLRSSDWGGGTFLIDGRTSWKGQYLFIFLYSLKLFLSCRTFFHTQSFLRVRYINRWKQVAPFEGVGEWRLVCSRSRSSHTCPKPLTLLCGPPGLYWAWECEGVPVAHQSCFFIL